MRPTVTCTVPPPGLATPAVALTPVLTPLFARPRSSLTTTDPDGLVRVTAGGDATADRNVADGDCIRTSLLPLLKLFQGGWEIVPDPPSFRSPGSARPPTTVSANTSGNQYSVRARARTRTKTLYGNHVPFPYADTGEFGTLFTAIRAPLSSIRRYRDDDASSPLLPLFFKLPLLPDSRSASLDRLALRTPTSENTLIDLDLPSLVIL